MSSLNHLQLQTLLGQTAIGVAVSDASGRLTMMSPALQELFQMPDEIVAEEELSNAFNLWSEDSSRRLEPHEVPLARARAGELVRDAVITALVPERGWVHLRCNAAPLMGHAGAVAGAIVLVQDVSVERKALEAQSQMRNRLLETINHEFRTPLAALLGHTELLQDQGDQLPPTVRRSLAGVVQAGKRLEELVRTISSLVDLEEDARLDRINCRVEAVVEQVAADYAEVATERDVTINVDVRKRLAASIDPAKLGKAVSALVANALNFAPTGSEVVLHVCGDDSWVQVTVSDTGPGIAAQDRERVVEPFERGDHPQQASSRGLGLAVARTIAIAHGGRLLLTENHPQGLIATVYAPRHGSAAVLATADPPPHEAGRPCPAGEPD